MSCLKRKLEQNSSSQQGKVCKIKHESSIVTLSPCLHPVKISSAPDLRLKCNEDEEVSNWLYLYRNVVMKDVYNCKALNSDLKSRCHRAANKDTGYCYHHERKNIGDMFQPLSFENSKITLTDHIQQLEKLWSKYSRRGTSQQYECGDFRIMNILFNYLLKIRSKLPFHEIVAFDNEARKLVSLHSFNKREFSSLSQIYTGILKWSSTWNLMKEYHQKRTIWLICLQKISKYHCVFFTNDSKIILEVFTCNIINIILSFLLDPVLFNLFGRYCSN